MVEKLLLYIYMKFPLVLIAFFGSPITPSHPLVIILKKKRKKEYITCAFLSVITHWEK